MGVSEVENLWKSWVYTVIYGCNLFISHALFSLLRTLAIFCYTLIGRN